MFWLACKRRLQKRRVFVGVWREWAPSAGAARPFASCSHSSDDSFSSFLYFYCCDYYFFLLLRSLSRCPASYVQSESHECSGEAAKGFFGAHSGSLLIWKRDPRYIDEHPCESATDPEAPTRSSGCLYGSLCVREIQNSCRWKCKLLQPAIVIPVPYFTFLSSFISLHLLMAALPDAPVYLETRHR